MSKAQTRVDLETHFAQYIAKRNGLTVEEAIVQVKEGTYAKPQPKPKKAKSKAALGAKKPKTLAQRIRKRLGPDDGRTGGSPTVQGGSPGLGKR